VAAGKNGSEQRYKMETEMPSFLPALSKFVAQVKSQCFLAKAV
jgi:hypothetical protein